MHSFVTCSGLRAVARHSYCVQYPGCDSPDERWREPKGRGPPADIARQLAQRNRRLTPAAGRLGCRVAGNRPQLERTVKLPWNGASTSPDPLEGCPVRGMMEYWVGQA